MSLSDLAFFRWNTHCIRIPGHQGWNWHHPLAKDGADAMRLLLPAGHFGQIPTNFVLFPKDRPEPPSP